MCTDVSSLSTKHGLEARAARPPERSGACGVPASDGEGGSGGAKPPGSKFEGN